MAQSRSRLSWHANGSRSSHKSTWPLLVGTAARVPHRTSRRCVSESPQLERSRRHVNGRSRWSQRRRQRCRRSFPTVARSCLVWWPTQWSSATAERVCSKVARHDQLGVERTHKELHFLRHICVCHAPEITEQRARSAVELVVKSFHGRLVKDPFPS